jgi:hypothetical protein
METDSVQIRKMVETRLILRALDDPAFRQKLITDPRAAFEEEIGVPFPAAANFQVIEESPGTVVLVVPKAAPQAGELSDTQLDAVAGGLTMAEVGDAMSDAWRSVKKALGGSSKIEWPTTTAVAGVRG